MMDDEQPKTDEVIELLVPPDAVDRDASAWTPPAPPIPITAPPAMGEQDEQFPDTDDDQPEHATDPTAGPTVANGDSAGRDPHSGRFLPGNGLWREGQDARIRKAVEVRLARLDRTRRLLRQLSLKDCELAVDQLRLLMEDDDPRVQLAAIKLLFDTVSIRDSDPEADTGTGKAPTFIFKIPAGLPVTRRVANEAVATQPRS